jgi:NAD+ diphosphatase
VPILQRLAFGQGRIDVSTKLRDDEEWLRRRWADPRSRVLVLSGDRAVASPESGNGTSALTWFSPADLVDRTVDDAVLLGVDGDGVAHFSLPVAEGDSAPTRDLSGELAQMSLRDAGATLSEDEASLFVHAVALARWHQRHQFCATCGHPTSIQSAGHVRRCPSCSALHFPRTDPAIIVLVVDEDDRCLLGHGAQWASRQFSTLAGFVEPGETLEQAVIREVHEESGVEVTDPVYLGSQPWPFPASLMLGFKATARTTAITTDDVEVTHARWFTRAELSADVTSGAVTLSSGVSISRRLIEYWYGNDLPANRPEPT